MDLDVLKCFRRIVALGSLSKAASELGISQPALTRQIKRLEHTLNSELLVRNSRGVQLTEIGEFLLSHPDIRSPDVGTYYSVNESHWNKWAPGIQRVVAAFKNGDGGKVEAKNARYIGSLVADIHRNLMSGGVFLYPADAMSPQGKLRLLYEAAPLAFVVEQAGGAATDGTRDILDIKPSELHQRTPLIIGSKRDVAYARAVLGEK